jgi:beta-glucosidase
MSTYAFNASRHLWRALSVVIAAVALMLPLAAPTSAQETESYPFRDPTLPVASRIDDLLGRLTLAEKISMLHQYQPAIPRLGIGPFKTGTEALHGLAWTTDHSRNGEVVMAEASVFPQALGLASTWDPDLVEQIGEAVGTEARAYNSENPGVWSLNMWAPVVDPLRDPRSGRNEEGYSEDAFLSGTMATSYAGGMRGDDPEHLRTAPTVKHYAGYNNEIRRDRTSSSLRPRLQHEYYDPGFRMPIEADAATGVMTSYNLVNGRPATVNPDVRDRVRSWTDETLLNVTDAFAPNNLVSSQGYFSTLAEANAATLKAGVDSFTTDNTNAAPTVDSIRSALDRGLLEVSDVDEAVGHILSIRFRLGEFDPDGGPYAGITKDVVNSPAHRKLAKEAASDSMVLLKNSQQLLPLDRSAARKIAVVGPLADTLYTDWYSGKMPYEVTPLQGIREQVGSQADVVFSEGVDRIALKDRSSGRYVAGGAGEAGGALRLDGTSPETNAQFDVLDWGEGILTLRNVANGRFVGMQGGGFHNNQEQPNGWFVQQQFKLEELADGSVVIRYAGYETAQDWFGSNKYITVASDGTLQLGAATPAEAAHFDKETLRSGVDSAVEAAAGADAVVVVVGSMPFINGREDHDRESMALAAAQQRLVERVHAANPNTVMVLENSYPTTISWAQEKIPAILWMTHAGQETGGALADVLFGEENPAGRLTQTWYRSESELPDILDYDIIKNDGTYQYYQGKPLYPFGHGLSYTSFAYDNLKTSSPVIGAGGKVTVSVDVTNTGDRAGDEVVQLYTHQRTSRDKTPIKALRAFDRVHLEPGQTSTVRLRVAAKDLGHWDVTQNKWVVETSDHDLMVGGSAEDIRQTGVLRVKGKKIPARDLSEPTRAVDFDDYSGIELVDESKASGEAVGRVDPGDWIKFSDTRLRRSHDELTLRTARAQEGATTVQVRLDDPVSGPLVGTVRIPSTGGVYDYKTVTAPVDVGAGRRDIYLVFGGDLRLSRLTLR